MRLAFRPIVILATVGVMTVLAGCGGKQMKLVVERETVIHDPVIQSVSFDGAGRVDTREQGQSVTVVMVGDPGLTATFDVPGMFEGRAMSEGPAGTYRGSFEVDQGIQGKVSATGHLLHEPTGAKAFASSSGALDLWISPAPTPTGCTPAMAKAFDDQLRALTVHFALDSEEIPDEARQKIQAAKSLLGSNAVCRIRVYGHTDLTGAEGYNKFLSIKRAINVGRLLEEVGVDNARLEKHAMGDKHPASAGTTDADHAKNRRAEIRGVVLYE
jgi:peptidoglycan-associated lipoprotein